MSDDSLTFFHAPNTRSSAVAVLMEELSVPHRLHVVNMKAGEQRQTAYVAKVNAMDARLAAEQDTASAKA